MKSILIIIGRNSCNQFKCKHLKNQQKKLKLSLQFLNLHQVLNIFDRKDNRIASVFAKIIGSEKRVYLNV